MALVAIIFVAIAGSGFAGLSWRLSRGPISLDAATPWLVEAIQEKLGGQQRVEVGGTLIERTEQGKTSVRLLNVVLRDDDGSVVASAPKVEVGLSGTALFAGQIRAERISLIGAEVAVRIEPDGRLAIFTGDDKLPVAVAPAADARAPAEAAPPSQGAPPDGASSDNLYRQGAEGFAAALAWVDSLSRTGLDGHDLTEIGLKSGTLVVEDRREGARWKFDNIDVSLNRPKHGGVQFKVQSGQTGRHWSMDASVTPTRDGRRNVRLDAARVPARDLLLALRFADLPFKADLPLSVRLRGEIRADGFPEVLQAAIAAEQGVVSPEGTKPIPVEHASVKLEWNAANRTLVMPLQLAAAGNRFTLLAQLQAPSKAQEPWRMQLGGGSIVLDSRSRSPLALSRIRVNAHADFDRKQIHVDDGELGNAETGLAFSGGFDYSGPPRFKLGLAGGRMSLQTMQRLWPPFISPDVRAWILEHISKATIERIDVAVNAPIEVLGSVGPPIPDDGLSIAVVAKDAVLQPIGSLPEIREATMDVHTTGRTVTVKVDRGAVKMPSGRTLTVSEGEFKIADTHQTPTMSRTRLRVQGPVAAAAELLAMERLRGASGGTKLDPATSRGNVNARVTLDIPLLKDLSNAHVAYALDAEFTNFTAERALMGHRLEAPSLHLKGDHTGYSIKGDVKVAGAPVSLDYRINKGKGHDEVRLQGVLDEATRSTLGLDLGPALTGPVPVKIAGRMSADEKDARFTVEADLTQARIDELLPGLEKPPAKAGRATFTLSRKGHHTRIDDLVYGGSGAVIRGNIVIDDAGDVVSANFPVYSLSSGDKVSLKVERGSDKSLQATLRGDVLDGRPFVKMLMAGRPDEAKEEKNKNKDLDLEVRVGAVAGHRGEALRGLELKVSRRGGRLRNFGLKAKLGRNATLFGDLRSTRSGRPALFVSADDAGALFRFTDTYSKIVGGRMTVVMDPPTSDPAPQHGSLNIENFAVRGEAALDGVVASGQPGQGAGVEFSAMRVDFTRSPGQMSIREGVVRGPVIGATIDGVIDYRTNRVRMRGTLVPLYGVNNMFGQLPIVGMFLGGSKEGLVGITYEVVGPVGAPVLRVNPISAVAPGFIRKFFEFPGAGAGFGVNTPPAAVEPTR